MARQSVANSISLKVPPILGLHSEPVDKLCLYTGRKVRHYALSNHKEYFAESTEAYFGVNDFYPFVRAELKEHDRPMFDLLEKIWGKVQ